MPTPPTCSKLDVGQYLVQPSRSPPVRSAEEEHGAGDDDQPDDGDIDDDADPRDSCVAHKAHSLGPGAAPEEESERRVDGRRDVCMNMHALPAAFPRGTHVSQARSRWFPRGNSSSGQASPDMVRGKSAGPHADVERDCMRGKQCRLVPDQLGLDVGSDTGGLRGRTGYFK